MLNDLTDVLFYCLIIAALCLLYWAWLVAQAAEQDARDAGAPGYTVDPPLITPAKVSYTRLRWLRRTGNTGTWK